MNASVDRLWFLGEPTAVQRRVMKAIGEEAGIPLEFKHIEEILRFASEEGKSGKELSLPLGWKIVRRPEELQFVTPDLRGAPPAQDYDYALSVPGKPRCPRPDSHSRPNSSRQPSARVIIQTGFWTRILCPDYYECGTGVQEIDSGRPIASPPRR